MSDTTAHFDDSTPAPRRAIAWAPMLLWCLIMATFNSFRFRTLSELFEAEGFDAQVKFQAAVWMGLGVLAVWLVASRRADLRLLGRGPLFWYCCLVAVALASSIYSPAPALTAYRSLQHAVALVLVISMRQHLESVYRFLVVFVALNWVLVVLGLLDINFGMAWIYNPAKNVNVLCGLEQSWRFGSALGHPSTISVVAAAGAAGLACRAQGRQWLVAGPLVAWLALTTVLTLSRTGMVGLAGGLAVAALGRRALAPWVCLAGVVVPLAMFSPDIQQATVRRLSRGQLKADFVSLTGRIPAYQEALRRIDHTWPLGEGFQSGRVHAFDVTGENLGVAHAHNLLMESLCGMGFLGGLFAVLVLLSVVSMVRTILRQEGAAQGSTLSPGWELAAMLVPICAFCVMDSGFVAKLDPVILLFLVIAARATTLWLDRAAQATGHEPAGVQTCPT
jgi:hypothetical protein